MKILIVCTGNSCRSQMAEYFLKSFDTTLDVHSAGSNPEKRVNSRTITVMNEIGIDMSESKPKRVDIFTTEAFDYVITVCGNARESCPVFQGLVKNRLHMDFEDPAIATGTNDEVMAIYRNIRDQIKNQFYQFYLKIKS